MKSDRAKPKTLPSGLRSLLESTQVAVIHNPSINETQAQLNNFTEHIDIGTGPLYAIRNGITVSIADVLSVLSLVFWALLMIVTLFQTRRGKLLFGA